MACDTDPCMGVCDGLRETTGSYRQTSKTVYSLHFGSNYANSGARAVYDQIVSLMAKHNTIPSFMSGGKMILPKSLLQGREVQHYADR